MTQRHGRLIVSSETKSKRLHRRHPSLTLAQVSFSALALCCWLSCGSSSTLQQSTGDVVGVQRGTVGLSFAQVARAAKEQTDDHKKEDEKQRAEEAAKQAQAEHEEQERLRQEERKMQQEIVEREEQAMEKERWNLKRRLNPFEERRVRRQVRSELTGGRSVRGEDSKAKDWNIKLSPEVRDQLDDAVKFFSETMRVPATLIGSAALGTLFIPPFKWGFLQNEERSATFMNLWRLYVILTSATFCSQLTVVLQTSNAHSTLLEMGRHGLALEPTAMDLIMSHMEFQYLTCILNFLLGVAAFMLAQFCRVVAVFHFARSARMHQETELSIAVGGMMAASLFWWLHLSNVRIMEFSNVGAMLLRYLQLLLARVRLGEVGVAGSMALMLTLVSLSAIVKTLTKSVKLCHQDGLSV